MANKIKQVRALRELQVDSVNELALLAQGASTDPNLHDAFKLRSSLMDVIYEEFERQHATLIPLIAVSDNPELEAEKEVRTAFVEKYFSIKAIYKQLFESNQSANRMPDRNSHVKLPKISLPCFVGDYKSWPTFFDLFSSLIHKNSNLSNIEKFQYLLSSLSKEPLNLIKNVPLTDENYNNAFTTLTERYQNKRLLATTCWQDLFNAPKLTSDSVGGLRKLMDTFSENLAALDNLGLPVESWDFVLYQILIQKLDSQTVKRFELEESSSEIPSYSNLKTFLLKQCTALESVSFSIGKTYKLSSNKLNDSSRNSHVQPKHSSSLVVNATNQSRVNCSYCKSSHSIYKCPMFLSKTPSQRFQIVKEKRWCTNCLHSAHKVSSCGSVSTCRVCQGKHHTLLHTARDVSSTSNANTFSVNDPTTSTVVDVVQQVTDITPINSLSNVVSSKTTVLLSTAIVEILDARGNYQSVRVLLDTASQTNIISQACLNRLGLPTSNMSLAIFGLGQTSSSATRGVTCTIRPKGQLTPVLTVDAVVLPKICSTMPSSRIPFEHWTHIHNIQLADQNFHVPGAIDILLGADVFPLILRNGRLVGTNYEPVALETIFGWILMGKVQCPPSNSSIDSLVVSLDNSLDLTLKKFWELEEVPPVPCSSPEDNLCEQLFVNSYWRDNNGRYSVALPFKGPEPLFGDSKSGALRRFYSLERRLLRHKDLCHAYCEFMKDYLESGHMELASLPPSHSQKVYYIPHHSVINPHSLTTKLRVVFDASCKTVNGDSLNNHLLIGKRLQKDIVALLLQFRVHLLVFTADIKQMYRQINIHSHHRDYQRILWRFSSDDPVQEFRLNTVTYGVSSAPFLALRTLLQLAEDEKEHFPLASKILQTSVYVDDVLTGCATLDDALQMKDELVSLLQKGGFSLRKWASNSSALLATIPESHRQFQFHSFPDEDSVVKILGLKWLPSADAFSYSVDCVTQVCTKRSILSDLARIFDPLGFLAPITFFAKHLIQYLWALGLEWDQTPPSDTLHSWNKYKTELSCLSSLHVPRCIVPTNFINCQLHGFSDSSEKGYSAVIYLRFELPNNKFHVSFLCAKSKVSPLKRISLPRLELCGAVLLSNLISFVVKTMSEKLLINQIFAWCDSSVTLSWIKSSPHRWKSFVSNRVSLIQEKIPPNFWFHIRSANNPADCASRGLFPSQLLNHPLWWTGPLFLKLPSQCWPTTDLNLSELPCPPEEERKITLVNFTSVDTLDFLLDKFSSLSKIKRIIAYGLRFIYNSKNPPNKKTGIFTLHELHKSLLTLIKRVQYTSFYDILSSLESNKPIPKPFRKLSLFIGEDGLLRVGGRLSNSGLVYNQKYPALLPSKHRLTELLIEDVHKQHLHPGLRTLQFLLAQNFWILSPRRTIRRILSKCIQCFKVNPIPFQPAMGDLPPARVNQIKPFQCVGVDYAGPIFITIGKSRGIKSQKAYICLFICFATKAIHLELASDLSTDCFLAALRRFIARRGRCTHIFSDCGSNFLGAKRELDSFMKLAVEAENVEWSFNPPSAPHFGGLWESGVKSTKSHLIRVIGNQILTYEEMYTVLVQIEAILNSRPLYAMSSDPNDLSVLTPGHFLTLEPLTTIPDPDLSKLSINRLTRWQLIQRIQQDFWKRWHAEYLHTLQQKNKWLKSNSPTVEPGSLVLIKSDLLPPLKWQLARIDTFHPGKDGISRVATVRTSSGLFQRPLVKLCPLPLSD